MNADRPSDHRNDVTNQWLATKDDSSRYTLLREYHGKSVYRFALGWPNVPTIIVKTWDPRRGSLYRRVKRAFLGELSGCQNEISCLQLLKQLAPGLGAPVGYSRHLGVIVCGRYCEVGLISDLGDCETVAEYLKRCNVSGDAPGLQEVADFITSSLRLLICDAMLIDDDHSVINMLRSRRSGSFHRIDFEIARPADAVRHRDQAIGSMIGRLIATCAFACQPDTRWVMSLARRLREDVPWINEPAWRFAQKELDRRLRLQFESKGIDTRLDLSSSLAAPAPGQV